MNELSMYAVLAFYALQATPTFSMVPEVHRFSYKVAKTYSVLALGIPNSAKTRNKDQIFILGQQNPFWIRNKDNSLTLAGPIKIVLSSADVNTTVQSMEKKIQQMYNLTIKFSSDTEIIVSNLRPSKGESLYCDLQDNQLNAMNAREVRKNLKPTFTYSKM